MFRRTLSRDAVLWWQGDEAQTIAVVESGRVGIRTGGRLLDVAVAGTALGEAALLAVDGGSAKRTADVVVLEDSVVVEYPLPELRDAGQLGIRQLLLRTLVAQIGRNHLLVAAAHPGDALVDCLVSGVLVTLGRCQPLILDVSPWGAFLVAFQFLYELRDGSDTLRRQLAARSGWTTETALGLVERLRPHLDAPELSASLEQFVRAEAERLRLSQA
jgi:CRP-like cAMP-binding protein